MTLALLLLSLELRIASSVVNDLHCRPMVLFKAYNHQKRSSKSYLHGIKRFLVSIKREENKNYACWICLAKSKGRSVSSQSVSSFVVEQRRNSTTVTKQHVEKNSIPPASQPAIISCVDGTA